MAFQLTGRVVLLPPTNLGQIRGAISSSLRGFTQTNNVITSANQQLENFGRQAGLAARRFAAFSIAAGTMIRFTRAIQSGVREAISFERELVKISQLGGSTTRQLAAIADEVGRLSSSLGVSSSSLIGVARTLRQAGFNIDEVRTSLDALAQAALAPNFGSIEDTVQGAIAAMRQFNLQASDLERTLGSINAVASAFAVDAEDITEAIQRAGGAFSSAGGNLQELVALFTSVRDTTRESASSISTGLRTIFTRLQRESTVTALEDLGINLRRTRLEAEALGNADLQGQFVGAFEAIRRISVGLRDIPTTDPRFARVVEQIGGFRQVSRVIPLIQRFGTAQQALNVAQSGGLSLQGSTARSVESLEVRLSRLNEQFLRLARDVVASPAFQTLASTFIKVGEAIGFVASVLKPVIPLLATFATFSLGKGIGSVLRGFGGNFFRSPQARSAQRPSVFGFNEGGLVPGGGPPDSIPAMLTGGEYVLDKETTRNIGPGNLRKLQRGGKVRPSVRTEQLLSANPDSNFFAKSPGTKPLYQALRRGLINQVPEGAKFLASGTEAVVFQLPNGNVMRVAGLGEKSSFGITGVAGIGQFQGRPQHSRVLQPVSSRVHNGYLIEELPFAAPISKTIDNRGSHLQNQSRIDTIRRAFNKRLVSTGYEPFDTNEENLAIVNGRVVAIDPNTFRHVGTDTPLSNREMFVVGGEQRPQARFRRANRGSYIEANQGTSLSRTDIVEQLFSGTPIVPTNVNRRRRPFEEEILPAIMASPYANEILQQIGGSRLIGQGSEAGVFRLAQDRVLRVGDTSVFPRSLQNVIRGRSRLSLNNAEISPEDARSLLGNILFRPNIPEVLQAVPGTTRNFGQFITEQLPFATPLLESGRGPAEQRDITEGLAESVRRRGLRPFDVAPRNIGFVGGRPLIVDPGAIARNQGGSIREELAKLTDLPYELQGRRLEEVKIAIGAQGDFSKFNLKAPITKEEAIALYDFTSSGSDNINKYLFGQSGYRPRFINQIPLLDSTLNKTAAPGNQILFHGTPYLQNFRRRNPGFLSTSSDPTIASRFGSNLLSILQGPGEQGFNISSISAFPAEKETILPRGGKFKRLFMEKIFNEQSEREQSLLYLSSINTQLTNSQLIRLIKESRKQQFESGIRRENSGGPVHAQRGGLIKKAERLGIFPTTFEQVNQTPMFRGATSDFEKLMRDNPDALNLALNQTGVVPGSNIDYFSAINSKIKFDNEAAGIKKAGRRAEGLIYNESFEASRQGQGAATESYARQILYGGDKTIRLFASRTDDGLPGDATGYYVWPSKFGADGPLTGTVRSHLLSFNPTQTLEDIITAPNAHLQDILRAPGGDEFWKRHGWPLSLEIDPNNALVQSKLDERLTSLGRKRGVKGFNRGGSLINDYAAQLQLRRFQDILGLPLDGVRTNLVSSNDIRNVQRDEGSVANYLPRGLFVPRTNRIFLNQDDIFGFNEFQNVLFHEAGHALDFQLGGRRNFASSINRNPANAIALGNLNETLDKFPSYVQRPVSSQLTESFVEFLQPRLSGSRFISSEDESLINQLGGNLNRDLIPNLTRMSEIEDFYRRSGTLRGKGLPLTDLLRRDKQRLGLNRGDFIRFNKKKFSIFNNDEADAFLRNLGKQIPITELDDAVANFTNFGYRQFNEPLIRNPNLLSEGVSGDISNLDKFLAQQKPLDKNVVLFRGLSSRDELVDIGTQVGTKSQTQLVNDSQFRGKIFTKPSFGSFSFSKNISKTFSNSDIDNFMLEVLAGKGTQFGTVRNTPELEMVSRPGQQFQIIGPGGNDNDANKILRVLALPRNRGGFVPGSGNIDSVYTSLPEGSFVLNKETSSQLNRGGPVPVALTPGERVFMPDEVDRIGVARLRLANNRKDASLLGFNKGGYLGLQNGGRPVSQVNVEASADPSRELNRLILRLQEFSFALQESTRAVSANTQRQNQVRGSVPLPRDISGATFGFATPEQERARLTSPRPPRRPPPDVFQFQEQPQRGPRDLGIVNQGGLQQPILVAGRRNQAVERAVSEYTQRLEAENQARTGGRGTPATEDPRLIRRINQLRRQLIRDLEARGVGERDQVAFGLGTTFRGAQSRGGNRAILQRAGLLTREGAVQELPQGQRFTNATRAVTREQLRFLAEQRGISREGGDAATRSRLERNVGGRQNLRRILEQDQQSQGIAQQRIQEVAFRQITQNQRLEPGIFGRFSQRAQEQARAQAAIEARAFAEGRTAGITDEQGNLVGLSSLGASVRPRQRSVIDRLLGRESRQQEPQDVLDRRNAALQQRIQTATIAASSFVSYINPLIRGNINATDAVREGAEGEFRTRVITSQGLTGATIGASAGAAFGLTGIGVGAAIGAITGVIEGFKQAQSQIEQAQLGKAISETANIINLQNQRLRLSQQISPEELASQNTQVGQNLGRSFELAGSVAERNLSILNFIPAFTNANFQAERNRIFGESIGNASQGLQENLLLQGRLFSRQNPGSSVDDIIGDILSRQSNVQVISALARQQGLTSESFVGTQLRTQIVNQEFERQLQENNNVLRELSVEFSILNGNFEGLNQTIVENTNAILNIGSAIRGEITEVTRPQLSNEILGTTRFAEITNRSLGGIDNESFRNARQVLLAGNALAGSGTLIETIRNQAGGQPVTSVLTASLEGLLRQQNIDVDNQQVEAFLSSFVSSVSGTGTNQQANELFDQGRTQAGIQEVLQSIPAFSQAFNEVNRLQATTQNLINNFDNLAKALVKAESEIIALDFTRASLAVQQRQAELSFQTPVRALQLARLPLAEAEAPIVGRRQAFIEAANRAGANLPVTAGIDEIVNRFNEVQRGLVAPSLARGAGLNPAIAGNLESNFVRLSQQANLLRQVLQDYTNVQENASAAQERLNVIREEESARLRTTESLLTSDPRQVAQIRFGLEQALAADRSGGNLQNVSLFQRQRIFQALQAFSGTTVNDNGREVNIDELRRRLLLQSGGGLNITQVNERESLQNRIIEAFEDGQRALIDGLISAETDQLTRLGTTLTQINNNFLTRLETLFANNALPELQASLQEQQATLGTATGLQNALEKITTASSLITATTGGTLQPFSNETFVTTLTNLSRELGNIETSRTQLGNISTQGFIQQFRNDIWAPNSALSSAANVSFTQDALFGGPAAAGDLRPVLNALQLASGGSINDEDVNLFFDTETRRILRDLLANNVGLRVALERVQSTSNLQGASDEALRQFQAFVTRAIPLIREEQAFSNIRENLQGIEGVDPDRVIEAFRGFSAEQRTNLLNVVGPARIATNNQVNNLGQASARLGELTSSIQSLQVSIGNLQNQIAQAQIAVLPINQQLATQAANLVTSGGIPIPGIGLATGGSVPNINSGIQSGTDSVLSLLTPGEFVVNAGATKKFLPLLKQINLQKFQEGGVVGDLVTGGVGNDGVDRLAHIRLLPFLSQQGRENPVFAMERLISATATGIANDLALPPQQQAIGRFFNPGTDVNALRNLTLNRLGVSGLSAQDISSRLFDLQNPGFQDILFALRPDLAPLSPVNRATPRDQIERILSYYDTDNVTQQARVLSALIARPSHAFTRIFANQQRITDDFGISKEAFAANQHARILNILGLPSNTELLASRLGFGANDDFPPNNAIPNNFTSLAAVVNAARTPSTVSLGQRVQQGDVTLFNPNEAQNLLLSNIAFQGLETQELVNQAMQNRNNLFEILRSQDNPGNLQRSYPNLTPAQLQSLVFQTRRRFGVQGFDRSQTELLISAVASATDRENLGLQNPFLFNLNNSIPIIANFMRSNPDIDDASTIVAGIQPAFGRQFNEVDRELLQRITELREESLARIILAETATTPDFANIFQGLPGNLLRDLEGQFVEGRNVNRGLTPGILGNLDYQSGNRLIFGTRRRYGLTGLDRGDLQLAVDAARQIHNFNMLPFFGDLLRRTDISSVDGLLGELNNVREQSQANIDAANATAINAAQTRDFAARGSFARTRNTVFGTSAFAEISSLIDASLQQRFEARDRTFGLGFAGKFATGGVIPGSGNTDSMLALTTPGEFILNKQATQAIGVGNLNNINRFQQGGLVGGGGAQNVVTESQPQAQLTDFSGTIALFNQSVNTFQNSAERLAQALSSIPDTIEMNASHRVEVIVNGAEVLQQLGGPLEELIVRKTREELNNFIKEKNPDLGLV